jgi:hypothetical protein
MNSELERKLQAVVDRQEIEQILKLYCRAIDRVDVDLLKSIYHPEATDDHGSFSGNAHEFADYITTSMRTGIIDGIHTVTHCTIDVDGNFATSEAYYWAYQLCPGGEDSVRAFFGDTYADAQLAAGKIEQNQDYYCGGRYIDLFEKRAGVWKILRRKITNEWNDIRPNERLTTEGHVAHFNLPGRRDRQDPVYLNTVPAKVFANI